MNPTTPHNTEAGLVEAILVGGPADIPDSSRVRKVSAKDRKVKLSRYGGYEHFERDDDRSPAAVGERIVFRWTGRTRIAE